MQHDPSRALEEHRRLVDGIFDSNRTRRIVNVKQSSGRERRVGVAGGALLACLSHGVQLVDGKHAMMVETVVWIR